MIRKLVQHGPSTLITSLPANWIKKQKLKRGDEIEFTEIDKGLLITNNRKKEKLSIKIHLHKCDERYIRMIVGNSYRGGVDIIELTYDDSKCFDMIQKIVDDYILGFEVITKTQKSCRIENLTVPTEDKFKILLRRIFYIIKDASDVLRKDINAQNFKSAEYIFSVSQKLGKYDNFCKRNIFIKRFEDESSYFNFLLCNYLMISQRSIYYLYKHFANKSLKIPKDVQALADNIVDLNNLIYSSYFQKDHDKILKAVSINSNIVYQKGPALLKKHKGELNILIHYLMDLTRNLYLTLSPTLGIIVK